jgi:hypothetical protein
LDLSASSIGSLGTKYKFPLEALGFVLGVTRVDAAYNANNYTIMNRLKDFVGHMGIGGVNIGGANSVASFTVQPGNILNNATYAYIGLELLGGMLPSDLKSLSHLAKPVLLGYAIGAVFDPAPGDAGNMGTGSNPFAGQQLTYNTIAGF